MLLDQAKPVVEYVPGWACDISAARTWEDLPQAAREYLRRQEDLTGVAPAIVSVGPDREETLLLRNPFAV